jgi:hypothetical protein
MLGCLASNSKPADSPHHQLLLTLAGWGNNILQSEHPTRIGHANPGGQFSDVDREKGVYCAQASTQMSRAGG